MGDGGRAVRPARIARRPTARAAPGRAVKSFLLRDRFLSLWLPPEEVTGNVEADIDRGLRTTYAWKQHSPGTKVLGKQGSFAQKGGLSVIVVTEATTRVASRIPPRALGGIEDRKTPGTDERVVDYLDNEKLRREEPLVSLFGAMERKVAGRWQIGDAVPVEPVTPNRKGRSVRSHPFQREPDLARFMDEAAYADFLQRDSKPAVVDQPCESSLRASRGRIAGIGERW